jgi:PAS domain S-box-containing protein
MVAMVALIFPASSNQPASSNITLRLENLGLVNRLRHAQLSAYLDTLNPSYLRAYKQSSQQFARESAELNKVALEGSGEQSAKLRNILLREAVCDHLDEQILQRRKTHELNADAISNWSIMRNSEEKSFDTLVKSEFSGLMQASPAHVGTLDPQNRIVIVLLGLVSSLSSYFLLKRAKPAAELLEICASVIGRNKLSVRIDKNTSGTQAGISTIAALEQVAREHGLNERALFEHAVDMVCLLDPFGKFVKVSPSCLKVTGYSDDELIGKRLMDLLSEGDDFGSSIGALHAAGQSTDLTNFETNFRTKDGRSIYLRWSAHWSSSDDALFCIAHDMTERKLAEDLIKESETRLKQLFAALPVGILLVDPDGHIKVTNSAVDRMLDYQAPTNSLIGRDLADVLPESAAMSQRFDQYEILDQSAVKLGGERIPVQIAVSNFGQEHDLLLVLTDMTSKLAVESMKREFIAMVGHDLRTPLTALKTFFGLLAGTQIPSVSAAQLVRNEREIDRLIRLINDLLDVEKMRSGKFEIHPTRVNIEELVESAINAVEHIAEVRKINITNKCSTCFCHADGARTIQVLVNLLSNSLKFSPKKSEITISTEENPRGCITISVKDQGYGIPQDQLEHIFDKFVMGKSSASGDSSGSGLGLHICKLIVAGQNGRIWAESNVEGGSTFHVTLPMSEDALELPGVAVTSDAEGTQAIM